MARKEKKYHYIYKTTNLKNGKYYIGMHSTDNLEDGYMGSGKRLRRSLNKYGKENFKFEILEFLPNRNSLIEREKELVNEELLKDSLSMNIKGGGEGGLINEEHHKKMLEGTNKWLKNKWSNDIEYRETKIKLWGLRLKKYHEDKIYTHKSFLGKQHKEESKKKIGEKNSIKQTGSGNSQFGTCWITNGKENKKIHKGDLIPDGWKLGRKNIIASKT